MTDSPPRVRCESAGRWRWLRGDPAHPQFFPDCVNILHQLCALGTDTRSFRADEPAELIAAEAKAPRAGLSALKTGDRP